MIYQLIEDDAMIALKQRSSVGMPDTVNLDTANSSREFQEIKDIYRSQSVKGRQKDLGMERIVRE